MNEMNTDRALSWDDEFTNEQQEFVLLPEGDYALRSPAWNVPALRAAPSCRPAPWPS